MQNLARHGGKHLPAFAKAEARELQVCSQPGQLTGLTQDTVSVQTMFKSKEREWGCHFVCTSWVQPPVLQKTKTHENITPFLGMYYGLILNCSPDLHHVCGMCLDHEGSVAACDVQEVGPGPQKRSLGCDLEGAPSPLSLSAVWSPGSKRFSFPRPMPLCCFSQASADRTLQT